MSKTIVDMQKVKEALDKGYTITLFANKIGSYTAEGESSDDREITDDYTPEQALTRLAYKIDGEWL